MTDAPNADFLCSNAEVWRAQFDMIKRPLPNATLTDVSNGMVLPLRNKANNPPGKYYFEGGVCDRNGKFIAGRRRSLHDDDANLSALWAYPVSGEQVSVRNESVVFGGVIFSHYGHLITDSTARLWHLIGNQDTRKIVFVARPNHISKFAAADWRPIFRLAGIDADRIEIIDKPTRFANITIPDETLYSFSGYRPEWGAFFDAVLKNVSPSRHRKVYFSRTHCKRNDMFNEDLFESYYKSQGFHIVYPETTPFEEQVACAAGAEEIVATIGTLSHNFLFCRPGTNATVLLRSNSIVMPQLLIGAARKLRCRYITVHENVLPAKHSNCVYYLAPTPFFKQALGKERRPAFGDECAKTVLDIGRIRPYVKQWLTIFATRRKAIMSEPRRGINAWQLFGEAFCTVSASQRLSNMVIDCMSFFVRSELRHRVKGGGFGAVCAWALLKTARRLVALLLLPLRWCHCGAKGKAVNTPGL